jgi:TPP-dependent pyruvate/acetoin dehydrogenase alpha subunit
MAKVEDKPEGASAGTGALSDERLRELFREMLLIRRFEEKVEERFRAGELPGFLHVETERLVGHYVGDPQVYRDKEQLHVLQETRDPITLLREKLGVSDEEFEDADREVQELVDASVELAKAGTDPKPEDALKNVYA